MGTKKAILEDALKLLASLTKRIFELGLDQSDPYIKNVMAKHQGTGAKFAKLVRQWPQLKGE